MPSIGGALRGLRKLLLQQLKTYVLFSVGVAIGEWVRHGGMNLLHRHKHRQGERRASSLQDHGRTFAVVTTAALPWRTGGATEWILQESPSYQTYVEHAVEF
jgi:hypothetical protein